MRYTDQLFLLLLAFMGDEIGSLVADDDDDGLTDRKVVDNNLVIYLHWISSFSVVSGIFFLFSFSLFYI